VDIAIQIPRFEIDDGYANPSEVAAAVRQFWKVPRGPIPNLVGLIEQAGVIVMPLDSDSSLFDGFVLRHAKAPIIFINKNIPASRMRFALAHELGHLVMHTWVGGHEEDEANLFASSFLMPEDDISINLAEMNWDNILYLKNAWKVSMAALIFRAEQIGTISSTRKTTMFQTLSRKGWRTREPGEFQKEKPNLIKTLLDIHKNELGYSADEISELMNLSQSDYYETYEPVIYPVSPKYLSFVPKTQLN